MIYWECLSVFYFNQRCCIPIRRYCRLRYWNNASSALETSAHRNPLIKEVLSPSTNIREINYMNIKNILTIRMLVSFPSGDDKSRKGD
jgi:hypothetical protein